jgi:RNA polymerase sigma factor (sigma-70 family)
MKLASLPDEERLAALLDLARRMASHWCRGLDEAHDVAQEAILRLLRSGAQPENPAAWLYVVTRRLAHRRHSRDLARVDAELAFAARAQRRPDLDLWIDVGSVVSRLGERDRELLTQVVLGAVSSEIAARFGCHVRDVGQMVSRARRKARRLMEACEG